MENDLEDYTLNTKFKQPQIKALT